MKQKAADDDRLKMVLTNFNDQKVLAIRSIDGKCSNWLNVIPVLRFGFVLCGRECRDLNCNVDLIRLPSNKGCYRPLKESICIAEVCRVKGTSIHLNMYIYNSYKCIRK